MPKNDDDDQLVPIKPEQARALAAEFNGTLTGVDYDLGDGNSWCLPNPRYLPPDMRKRYQEHLRFINEDLDKVKETAEHPVTGKRVTTERIKWPLRFGDELIDEDELMCIALMGTDAKADRAAYFENGALPDTYAQFLKAGGVPGQIQVHWQMMNTQMAERVSRDSKSR